MCRDNLLANNCTCVEGFPIIIISKPLCSCTNICLLYLAYIVCVFCLAFLNYIISNRGYRATTSHSREALSYIALLESPR